MFNQQNTSNTANNANTPNTANEEKPFYTNKLVIGVDEVGRGCFMGDVVTCACIINTPNNNTAANTGNTNANANTNSNSNANANQFSQSLLNSSLLDSKLMKKQNRLDAVKQLLNNGAIFAINSINAKKIDEINILQATLLSMRGSINDVLKILKGDTELMNNNAIKACNILGIKCTCANPKTGGTTAGGAAAGNTAAGNTAAGDNDNCIHCNYIAKQAAFVVKCQKFINGTKSGASPIAVLIDGNHAPANMWQEVSAIVPFIKGDSKHKPISAASIIAKEYRDWDVATNMHPLFPSYHWDENFGYGTKPHIDAIKQYGVTNLHRVSFLTKILQQTGNAHAGSANTSNTQTDTLL